MKVGPHVKTWTPLEPLHLWPSLKSQRDEAFVSDSESLTSVRQQDIISYFSEPRWHKFQLPTSYFLKPAASREVSQGGKSRWQSAPRCPHSSFAFKSNTLQIVFLTENEDVSTVGALFRLREKELPQKTLLNNADETRLCVRAIVSISIPRQRVTALPLPRRQELRQSKLNKLKAGPSRLEAEPTCFKRIARSSYVFRRHKSRSTTGSRRGVSELACFVEAAASLYTNQG